MLQMTLDFSTMLQVCKFLDILPSAFAIWSIIKRNKSMDESHLQYSMIPIKKWKKVITNWLYNRLNFFSTFNYLFVEILPVFCGKVIAIMMYLMRNMFDKILFSTETKTRPYVVFIVITWQLLCALIYLYISQSCNVIRDSQEDMRTDAISL